MTDRFDPALFTADNVSRLVASQFPQWANLPVREVSLQGWDNRTFRLGDELSVRLPSAAGYVPQTEKEHRWLPRLAPCLPLPIPVPLAKGQPAQGYPSEWSIYRWLPGEPVATACIPDLTRFASDLASFLGALYRIDPDDGPIAGPHSFYRGGPLSTYDAETRRSIDALRDEIDVNLPTAIWEEALAATWQEPPVWVHGDVAVANLLVQDGRLSAVIDFGCSAVGDPACDTVIAWTFFSGSRREAFLNKLPVEPGAWTRVRGWALWIALILIAGYRTTDEGKANEARRILTEVLNSPL
jgi:aminoglycoside phosphotransferase (APT) family kinase protein